MKKLLTKNAKEKLKIHDLSVPIYPGMLKWLDDEEVELRQELSIANGAAYNLSRLTCSSHVGTHIDAPYHFTEGGKTIDQVSLQDLMGEALVVEVDVEDRITAQELANVDFETYKRILFKTRNSALLTSEDFTKDYVALDYSAAELLVENHVRVVGIDYLSIDESETDEHPVHKLLTGNDVIILEELDLSKVAPGAYFMVALPLKLNGCDGAPARVVLVEF